MTLTVFCSPAAGSFTGFRKYPYHFFPRGVRYPVWLDVPTACHSLANAVDHSVSLIYAGRIEARLHQPKLARQDLEQAKKIMEQLVAVSPQHHYFFNTLEEVKAALRALPTDTAPLAAH